MSFFVELPPSAYPAIPDEWNVPAALDMATAKVAMWFSQLAYEVHKPETIEAVRQKWSFQTVQPFLRRSGAWEARGVIAERRDVIVFSVSGMDPAVWRDLIAISAISHSSADTHCGFEAVFQLAWRDAQAIIRSLSTQPKALLVTGHSMGAAIAALVAERLHDEEFAPTAVYLFGMPRTGGEVFRSRYNAKLGSTSYRLVHGADIVCHTPPSLFGYQHVGRALHSESGMFSDELRLNALDVDEDARANKVRDDRCAAARQPDFLPSRLKVLYDIAPQRLRDHFPASYCAAFGPEPTVRTSNREEPLQ